MVVLLGFVNCHVVSLDNGRGEFAVVPAFFVDVADGAGTDYFDAEFVGGGADVFA